MNNKKVDTKNKTEIIDLSLSETPKFIETTFKDWVLYGEDNEFPDHLNDLVNESALHNAIVSSKVDAVKGKGLIYEDMNTTPDIKTDTFMKNCNPNETLNDIFYKCAYDLVLYGGFSLELIYSKDRKSIAELYHIAFDKIRSGKSNDRNVVENYWFSKNWCKYRQKEFIPKPMKAYNKNNKDDSQLLYCKEYRPGIEYYPLPTYIGALNYIKIDSEISEFHLSHIQNGMSPSMMISFNGIPSDEERKTIKRQIKEAYTGSHNAGKIIVNWSDSKEQTPEVSTLSPAQLDKQLIQLADMTLQQILCGHKIVSPLLVGIRNTNGFGNNANELETSYELFNNQVITPLKEQLLKSFNMIMEYNGMKELNVESIAPVSFTWSENVLSTIMSKDEMREKISLDPIPTTEIVDPTTTQNNPIV